MAAEQGGIEQASQGGMGPGTDLCRGGIGDQGQFQTTVFELAQDFEDIGLHRQQGMVETPLSLICRLFDT